MSSESKETAGQSFMLRLAAFVVNKRNAFVILFIIACIYCASSINKVEIIEELTDYLPETTETRKGLDLMDREFVTYGTARVLLTNVTYERAKRKAAEIENIRGISSVKFYDFAKADDEYEDDTLYDYYKDASALLTVTFDEAEDTPQSQHAMAQLRDAVADCQTYIYTTVDYDEDAMLKNDMKYIMLIAVAVIFGVLLFTSGTYMEIIIFMVTFLVAIVLNMGTNYIFHDISFVTNAVAAVLQLALSIDYAIILFHRFMEEKEKRDTIDAITVALSKAIPEISSSSLTTVAGMVALMFMQYGIGGDMGRVLTKAIVLSLLTVFLLMPALIVFFADWIEKTKHKSFVPSIRFWGQIVVRFRHVGLAVFVVIMAAGFYFSSKCPYIFDKNSVVAAKMDWYLTAKHRIEETFLLDNTMAVVVPLGDHQKEAALIRDMDEVEGLKNVTGLSSIEVDDDGKYILVDELKPREFAEVADLDLGIVRLLYRFYAIDNEQWGAFMKDLDEYKVPIIDMIDFIYDQNQNGGLDLDDDMSDDIEDLHKQLTDARNQLEGENYTRIVFSLTGPVEGDETFAKIDQIRAIAHRYYDEAYVVGNPTSNYDLSNSFLTDNRMISILTALFVGVILLFTFQSAGLPLLLVLTIQSSIWINFSLPTITGGSMFFISYLIVSAIQMGATIDYAIVITSRYMALRKTISDKKEVVIRALDEAFPTVVTSGTILTAAGFVVSRSTSNGTIASLGSALYKGTFISIVLVMSVLPQILMVFDRVIEKTAFNRGRKEEANE